MSSDPDLHEIEARLPMLPLHNTNHGEVFLAVTGKPIIVGCDCLIGRTHSYGDWLAIYAPGLIQFDEAGMML